MNLPIINTFKKPHEAWSYRDATEEEMMAHYQQNGCWVYHMRDKLLACIRTPFEAAVYMLKVGCDNELENAIDNALDNDVNWKNWRKAMPGITPPIIAEYQQKYPPNDMGKVSDKINEIGETLSEGQFLFHGGTWPIISNEYVTSRPLSTTFCPQIALRNTEWKGKAYEAKQVEIWVLRAHTPNTKVFAYRKNGTSKGHEKEVVFAAGAKLQLRRRHEICSYTVANHLGNTMVVPAHVLEVDIS